MCKITVVHNTGSSSEVPVETPTTLMRALVRKKVPGVLGRCGGKLVCGTCHVYIEDGSPALPEPNEVEAEMLDYVLAERMPTSRLSCQIAVDPNCAPISIRIPDRQI